MNVPQKKPLISEQEYLEGELLSEVKHELIDGEVYAMAGASKIHSLISTNLITAFSIHLKDAPCLPYSSDVKVKVEKNFYYPDIMVVCDDQTESDYYTESPVLIIEVLSPSTRKMDQRIKRQAYQSLPTLQEYVLIEQAFIDVEVCRRTNHWQSEHYYLEEEVHFASIELSLPVADIYSRVPMAETMA